MEVLELCKKIGIEDFWGLERFKKENCSHGENLLIALKMYLVNLGQGWCIK